MLFRRRIPRAVGSIQEPAPVGVELIKNPHRLVHGPRQVRRVEHMVIAVAYAVRGSAERRELVWLTRMRDDVGINEQRAARRQAVDKWRTVPVDGLAERVIFQNRHDDVIEPRQIVASGICRLNMERQHCRGQRRGDLTMAHWLLFRIRG